MMKLMKEDLRVLRNGFPVQSETSDRQYIVKLIESPFNVNKGKLILSCSCPAWKFNHGGKRVCKHIRRFLKEEVHPNTVRHLVDGIEAGLIA